MERNEKTLTIEQFSNYSARILSSDIRTFESTDAKASSNHDGHGSKLESSNNGWLRNPSARARGKTA